MRWKKRKNTRQDLMVFHAYALAAILPERDYVTFEYMLSHIRLSSVTFVRHTQPVIIFDNDRRHLP